MLLGARKSAGEFAMGTSANQQGAVDWKSDFFGTLNEMPPEPVTGISNVLEAMSTLPAYRDARRWLLRNLGLSPGAAVLEAGCGIGGALPDILAIVGTNGRVAGIDPTHAFIERARSQAKTLCASNATYEIGDIRSIPAKDSEFDAAFCDKVLIHVGPAKVALAEMKRITRTTGRVGALEWLPFFAVSSRRTEAMEAFNAVFKAAVHDYYVCANLARHFHSVGLQDVRTQALLAHTDNLNAHPFWRAFMVNQLPMFIHVGLIDAETAKVFQEDLEELHAKGEFSASFIVQAAVGTK
jgi:ubiquinone/menaquinone biosynthesis C-methylase UbiE